MRAFGLEIRRAPVLTPVPSNRGGWWTIREPSTGAWQRNQEWTTQNVLAHHAVYSCITRISQDIGKLRPKLVELDDDGIWTETNSPSFSPVLSQPNRFQNYIQFQEWWITSKLIHGNSYALLERDGRGVVVAMYVLDPTRVTVLLAPDGSVFYDLKADNLAGLQLDSVAVPASEIIHDRMNCLFHPLVGFSPIFACGAAANMGLTIETNSTSFFGNGSNPSGILSSPQQITPEKSKQLSSIWNAQFGGNGSGGVAVLGDGMKFEPMRMSATDSQLIEQLGWTGEIVCACFHVPPFKVGIGQQPTYQNAEILNQIYYSDCLQSHIEAYELSMDQGLGLRKTLEGGKIYGVELDLDGLLRMDTAAQMDTLSKAVGGSIMSINEARWKLDLRPKDGGDSILSQQQYYSIEALAERDKNGLLPWAKPTEVPVIEKEQKQLTSGELSEGIREVQTMVEGIVPVLREYIDKSVEENAVAIQIVTDAIREENRALKAEITELRSPPITALATISDSVEGSVEVEQEETDSLEMWDGWFARDSLAIVREAQELELRTVQQVTRSAETNATNEAIASLTASMAVLASREAPPTIVNVAPAEVRVEPPQIQINMEAPKPGTKTLVIQKPGGETVTATVEEK